MLCVRYSGPVCVPCSLRAITLVVMVLCCLVMFSFQNPHIFGAVDVVSIH